MMNRHKLARTVVASQLYDWGQRADAGLVGSDRPMESLPKRLRQPVVIAERAILAALKDVVATLEKGGE